MSFWRTLHRIVIGGAESPMTPASRTEMISGVAVPVEFVQEQALLQPEIQPLVQTLRSGLLPLLGARVEELFDPLALRVAAYVMDLPASAAHHHARKWGLLVHSLEAARLATSRALCRPPGDDLTPQWIYATCLLALCHDLGKVLDVQVSGPSGQVWDPFEEPVVAFHLRFPDGRQVTHRPGRQNSEHERAGPLFMDRVLTSAMFRFMYPIFGQALTQSSETARSMLADVRQADIASGRSDIGETWVEESHTRRRKKENPPEGSSGGSIPLDHKKFYGDLREAILLGQVERNSSRTGTLFITPEWCYLVLPNAFKPLKDRGYAEASEPGAVYPMIQALVKMRIAWENPKSRRSIFKIRTPPQVGAPLSVIACKTGALLTEEEQSRLGFWPHDVEHLAKEGPPTTAQQRAPEDDENP
jgi:hypothetical protein